jgi:hypothetical protein
MSLGMAVKRYEDVLEKLERQGHERDKTNDLV